MTKQPFIPQVDDREYEITPHNVILTGGEISTILFYLDQVEDNQEVNAISTKLEGVTDRWYNFQESMLINQQRKNEEYGLDEDDDEFTHDSEGC